MAYLSVYPPAHSDTYVKATSNGGVAFRAWFTTNPALLLIGSNLYNQWLSSSSAVTNQRFHIDLGEAKTIKRIYYENSHSNGGYATEGAQNFTLWGSNEASAFSELTYGIDTNWTQLTTSQSTFDQHVAANQVDPKYITITNTTAYRYYALKFADNYGSASRIGVRRIELQIALPEINTDEASSVAATSATLNGELTSLGSSAAVDVYFQYRVKDAEVWETTTPEELSIPDTFDFDLAGLAENTEYEFRAGVDWADGSIYGDTLEFTTLIPSDPNYFVIDEPVTLASGGSYQAKIRFSDDTIETRDVTNPAGYYSGGSIISVDPSFSQYPKKFDLWAIGLEELCTKPFRLLAIQRDKVNEVILSGLEYNETVYDDSTGIILPTPDYTALVSNAPVTDLILSERLIKMGDKTIESAIDVSFQTPQETIHKKCNIYLSYDDGESWEYRGETKNGRFSIAGNIVKNTTYYVAVSSINNLGQETPKNQWVTKEIYTRGKTELPTSVTGLRVYQDTDRLELEWNNIFDADFDYYEIRRGNSWTVGSLIDRTARNNLTLTAFPFGSQIYWVSARDTSGNYSATPAVIGVDVQEIANRKKLIAYWDFLEGEIGEGLDTEYAIATISLVIMALRAGRTVLANDLLAAILAGETQKCVLLQTISTWDADETTWDEAEAAQEGWDYSLHMDGYYTLPVQDVGFLVNAVLRCIVVALSESPTEATYSLEARYSNDNISWSAWEEATLQDTEFRYFQTRIKLATTNDEKNIRVFGVEIQVSLPEKQEWFYNQAISDTGTAIVFTKTFHTGEISVMITPIDNPYTPYVSDITKDGCTVYLRDTEAQALTAGNVNITVTGF
ncbi:MAG: discoidin domain-containing protein [Patescibacteria group bacterium]|jgi:hypothetical protein